MKNKINIVVGAAVVCILSIGCERFLDKQPTGVESSATFFKTADQATKAVTAVYDVTGWHYSQELTEWFLGDICSDDAEKGGENAADWAELQQLKEFRGTASNTISYYRWSEFYQGVFRANLVIVNVPGIAMDTTLRARLVAEAKFLRAYFYFQLVKTFGGVPLVTHPLSPSDYCQPRATIEECWTQIEKDLSEAADVLPEKSKYNASDMGRATRGAANSLLAKAYIFQKKWGSALSRATLVIDSKEYDLEPNYSDIFKHAHENGTESVYEIQHMEIPTSLYADLNEGQETSIYQGSRKATYFTGWGFNCPTLDFVKEFEPNDPRLNATVVFDGDIIYENTSVQQKADNGMSPTKMGARKYMLEYEGAQTPGISNAPANWKVIRFADVVLFHAEAANETGDAAAALKSLNRVRKRVSMPEVTTTDQDSLRQAIYHERRVELGLEGQRFFDLVRQARAAQVLAPGFLEGKHEYFPIPQVELDVCNQIKQNPYF